MTDQNEYTVEQSEPNVITVKFPAAKVAGWEQWLMLTGDRHHDNLRTNWNLERAQLEKAKQRNAMIIDVGDLFCAMQGKYDKRSDMTQVRPEHVGADYLDRLVKTAFDFYRPYASNFLMLGHGNHETSVIDRHGTDLTSNLVHRLNSDGGAQCYVGGIGGWVRFQITANKTCRQSVNLKYHHGAGGGGPVTKGTIQTNRQAVYLPDADIVVNGHTHDSWVLPIARERLNIQGYVRRDLIWFVRTPGYKDDYGNGADGFHNLRWGAPKPLGCVWVRLFMRSHPVQVMIEAFQDVE